MLVARKLIVRSITIWIYRMYQLDVEAAKIILLYSSAFVTVCYAEGNTKFSASHPFVVT